MTTLTSVARAFGRHRGRRGCWRCGSFCLAAVAVVCTAPARSQSPAAQTQAAAPPQRVIVLDPSGARIPHATVTVFQVRSADDAAVQTLHGDQVGELQLNLPAGTYDLRIAAQGFLDGQQVVEVGRTARQPVLVRLKIAAKVEAVEVPSEAGGDDSISDGQSLVLRGQALRALSDNPTVLQQQINALVPTDDGSTPQLRIDGFTGGRLPPKASIREIRVNQNAYSAQFDQRGNSVVDIFTKPGGNKVEGGFYLSGNADPLNARNPYLTTKPAYHSVFGQGYLSGPLGKNTSYFASAEVNDLQNSAAVNATVLDASFNVVPFAQTVSTPSLTRSGSLRLDHQFGERNTVTGRAEWNGAHQDNAGIGAGQLVLPSQAFTSTDEAFTLQLGDTFIVNPKTVVETRFQYSRTRTSQVPVSSAPALIVQGGFNGGGSPAQTFRDALDSYEFQEYLSFDRSKHFYRAGVRYRLSRDSNSSTATYNGQYTFSSLAAYQITLRGQAAGLTPAQIRAQGGGASQYNVTAGTPAAVILTGDLGAYFEDEWKVRPNFSLISGIRYESQIGIPDHNDPAPRLGFSWAISRKGQNRPLVTLRGGAGFFYDRFAAGNILTATRQNGILQRAYYLQNPDTYPTDPPPASLGSVTPTVYQIAPNLRSPYVFSQGVSAEHNFGKFGRLTLSFTHEHGTHQLVSRNANAPLNGVRPLGGTQNVYQYASLGTSETKTFSPYYSANFGDHGGVWVNYSLRYRESDSAGAGSFVSNSYNMAADYARTAFLSRHRLFVGGWFRLPFQFSTFTYFSAHSPTHFNITTGQDNNGDSIFNDRPAFATDLSRPSVVRTALGDFDTSPVAGQTIIPMNYGVAPAFYSLQGQLSRGFVFGPKLPQEPAAPGAKAVPPDRRFKAMAGVEAQNVFNHNNPSVPIGQLSSPFFGRSLSLNLEQTGSTAANRVVNLFLKFDF